MTSATRSVMSEPFSSEVLRDNWSSSCIWFVSAGLATWHSTRAAIAMLLQADSSSSR